MYHISRITRAVLTSVELINNNNRVCEWWNLTDVAHMARLDIFIVHSGANLGSSVNGGCVFMGVWTIVVYKLWFSFWDERNC